MKVGFLATTAALALAAVAARGADDPVAFTLDNGLRVRLVSLKGADQVDVVLGVRAGFCAEAAGLPHAAHVTEHLVVYGQAAGSEEAGAVTRWFHHNGVNGETLPGWMYFDLHVEPADLDMALRVQAVRLTRPAFTGKLLAREVPRALAEVEFLEQSRSWGTGKFAYCAFTQAAIHGQTEIPIKARTRSLRVDDLRRFHETNFRPDRAMLVVVGAIDPVRARAAVNTAFGSISRPPARVERPGLLGGTHTVRWDVNTRHLIIAWPLPPATLPEHAALSVAGGVLADRLTTDPILGRLVKIPLVTTDVEGLFLVNVQLQPGADVDAVQAQILKQTDQLATEPGLAALPAMVARRELLATLHPGGLLAALAPPGMRLSVRTNQELQIVGKTLVWGDLDAYATRLSALEVPVIRAATGRFLNAGKAVTVRVEPMPLTR